MIKIHNWPTRTSLVKVAATTAVTILLAGCGSGGNGLDASGSSGPKMFDLAPLTAAALEPVSPARKNVQLTVPEPTAIRSLDGDRVVVQHASGEINFLSGAQWSDRLPALLQARLIQSLSSSGRFRAISNGRDKVDAELSLVTSIQAFQADVGDGPDVAHVAIHAKIVDERSGNVIAVKVLSAKQPINGKAPSDFVAAINQSFAVVSQDLVTWVAQLDYKTKKGPMPKTLLTSSIRKN